MQQVTIQSDRIIVTQRGGSTILLGKYAYACRYSTAGASPPGLEPLYYTVSVFFDEGKGPVNLDTGERQDEYVFDLRFVEKTSQPTWNNTEQGAENAVLAITPFLRAEECCPSGTPGAVIAVNQAQCWNLLDPTWGVQPEQLIDCVIPSIDFCDPEFLAALTEEQLVCIIPTCDPLTATLNGVEIINEADPCGAEITLDCDDPVNALVVESSGEPAETLLFVPGADLFGFHAWYAQPQLDPAFAIAWSVADEAWGIWNITGETFEAVSTGDQSSPITATWEGFTVRQATIADLCGGAPVPCEDASVTWDGEPLLTIPSGGTQDLDCNTLVNAAYAVDGGSVTGTYKPDGTLNSREVFRLDVSHNFQYTGTRWRLVKPGSDYDAALGSETKPWDADWTATPVTVTQATIGAYCDDCVPCDDANVEINGTAFDTVAAGGTLDIPVVNTAATPVGTVNAGVDVVVPDATYQLKDSAANNIASPGAIASGASANITAPDATVQLRDSAANNIGSPVALLSNSSNNLTAPDATVTVNSAAFGNALSNGSLDVPVVNPRAVPVGSKVGSDWLVPDIPDTLVEFTAGGTYTPPAGLREIVVFAQAPGGGGGGGRSNSTGGSATGGGAGGSGSFVIRRIPASSLGGPVTVTIDAPGTGGAGGTNSNGSPGTTGGDASFGSLVIAKGGAGGQGGAPSSVTPTQTALASACTPAFRPWASNGANATAQASTATLAGANGSEGAAGIAGTGGRGGGRVTSGTPFVGGDGGGVYNNSMLTAGAAGASTAGANGSNGADDVKLDYMALHTTLTPTIGHGTGGGGGAYNGAGNGGNGGTGGKGTGGAGGGGSINTATGGTGASGGAGFVVVLERY
jgi:hypothetical protein